MHVGLFIILVVVLAFVSSQWQYGEALPKDRSETPKNQLISPQCDTFFHVRNVNDEEVRPIVLYEMKHCRPTMRVRTELYNVQC